MLSSQLIVVLKKTFYQALKSPYQEKGKRRTTYPNGALMLVKKLMALKSLFAIIAAFMSTLTYCESLDSTGPVPLKDVQVDKIRPYLGKWLWVQSEIKRTQSCFNIRLSFNQGELVISDDWVKRTFEYTAERIPSTNAIGFNLILVSKAIESVVDGEGVAKDCNGREIKLVNFKSGKMQFVFIELSDDYQGLKLYHEGGQKDWFKKES